MDKYEYKVRTEEIKELIARKEYAQAAEIADTIDWRRVKSVMMLCTISDLYKINRRYEDSRDLLLLAYDKHPTGRTIVYALCELAVKMGDLPQAVEYCKEYVQLAPKDPGRYILQYKIYEAQEVSLEERIAVLEELKKRDYREKWAYELAYLYHRIGLESKCVDECDELIVWFGEGKYVIRAMELKMLHQPLIPQQQEKYDRRFAPKQEAKEPVVEEVALQQQNTQPMAEPVPETIQEATTIWSAAYVADALENSEVEYAQTRRIPTQEIEIQVKTMDPSQCNTINLQEEVAAGLREIWENKSQDEDITRAIIAPMMETDHLDTKEVVTALEDAVIENTKEEAAPEPVIQKEAETDSAVEQTEEPAKEAEAGPVEEESSQEVQEEKPDTTATQVMEQLRIQNTAELPKDMDKVLSMEADGQISFVVEEKEAVEKQITGQISIEDIMAEWERMKKELEEKNREKIRQSVKANTGQMFTDFEASVRDGLLEQLEKGEDMDEVIARAESVEWEKEGIEVPPSLQDTEEECDEEPSTVEESKVVSMEDYREHVAETVIEEEEGAVSEENIENTEEDDSKAQDTESQENEPQETESSFEAVAWETEKVLEETDEVEELTEIEESDQQTPMDLAYEAALAGIAVDVAEAESVLEEVFEEEIEEVVEEEFEEEPATAQESELKVEASDKEDEWLEETETLSLEEDTTEEIIEEETKEQEPAEESAHVRRLTKEEKELFSPYIQGRSSKEQLIQALDNISMAAYTGNVIITGSEGLDTLGLARNIIRDVQMTDNNFSGKTAKISGESLNKREVSTVLEGLVNGALIVQHANDMSEKTVEELYKALQQENTGMVVVLEGNKKAMNAFLEQYPKLHACFTSRIDMEALSEMALVAFCKKYAREKECSIDEMGILELHRVITNRQTNDHAVTLMEVKEIMDDAIDSACKKSLGHFMDILMAKRYDEEDMVIIREKDFR